MTSPKKTQKTSPKKKRKANPKETYLYAIEPRGGAAFFRCPIGVLSDPTKSGDRDEGALDDVLISSDAWEILGPHVRKYLEPRLLHVSIGRSWTGGPIIWLPANEGLAIGRFIFAFYTYVEDSDLDLQYLEARAREWFTLYIHADKKVRKAFLDQKPTP